LSTGLIGNPLYIFEVLHAGITKNTLRKLIILALRMTLGMGRD
jgi:hypothetical protein